MGEEANLEQQQNDPLGQNDKETAETETSMEIVPVVAKEQTVIVGGDHHPNRGESLTGLTGRSRT